MHRVCILLFIHTPRVICIPIMLYEDELVCVLDYELVEYSYQPQPNRIHY